MFALIGVMQEVGDSIVLRTLADEQRSHTSHEASLYFSRLWSLRKLQL